jgi:hypothetical protein
MSLTLQSLKENVRHDVQPITLLDLLQHNDNTEYITLPSLMQRYNEANPMVYLGGLLSDPTIKQPRERPSDSTPIAPVEPIPTPTEVPIRSRKPSAHLRMETEMVPNEISFSALMKLQELEECRQNMCKCVGDSTRKIFSDERFVVDPFETYEHMFTIDFTDCAQLPEALDVSSNVETELDFEVAFQIEDILTTVVFYKTTFKELQKQKFINVLNCYDLYVRKSENGLVELPSAITGKVQLKHEDLPLRVMYHTGHIVTARGKIVLAEAHLPEFLHVGETLTTFCGLFPAKCLGKSFNYKKSELLTIHVPTDVKPQLQCLGLSHNTSKDLSTDYAAHITFKFKDRSRISIFDVHSHTKK